MSTFCAYNKSSSSAIEFCTTDYCFGSKNDNGNVSISAACLM